MFTSKEMIAHPVFEEDYPAAVSLINMAEQAAGGKNIFSVPDMAAEMKSPGFHPETDTLGIWSPDGQMLGYAENWNIIQPYIRVIQFHKVHPDYSGSELENALLEWMEQRALQDLPKAPENARVVIHNRAYERQIPLIKLYEQRGYARVRSSSRMRVNFNQPPAKPVIPDGIVLRVIRPEEADIRAALKADHEAFQDHWGFVQEPFEGYYQRWKHYFDTDPAFDLSACFVAMAGDEVAGVAINAVNIPGDENIGWVNTIGVRRPWRKRGVGLALLLTCFNEFFRRGKSGGGLGVDMENLTGALRLYERAGMFVEVTSYTYEKELRPGVDLMVQNLAA